DQDIRVATEPGMAYDGPIALVEGDEPYTWTTGAKLPRGFQDDITAIYLTNEGDAPAAFTYRYATDVPIEAVHHLPVVVGSVVGVFALYLLIQALLPGVGAITAATAKEAMGQPLFLLLTGIGSLLMVGFLFVPYNTFGEDVKLLLQSGMEVTKVFAILFAIWTASTSIADEIEGKTALTLLSKPISRRQFILGKFAGIVWPVLLIFVIVGAFLMTSVSYKVVYDARETSNPTPKWEECYDTMAQAPPGLLLSFLEAVVLTAISVALSTRLPMLPNLIICGSVYVLGHLGALIVQSSLGQLEYVEFFGKLVAVVVPVLDHFSIEPAIAGGVPVPADYLLWATLYCVLYSTAAMLLALILFEDRDLA
ncbi:MAG: ABC transporter permease, partial [Planctomycetota bacterium]